MENSIVRDASEEMRKRRAKRRAMAVAGIRGYYSPRLHFAASLALAVGASVVALPHLKNVSTLSWFTVPFVLITADAIEWVLHRYVMHRYRWFASGVFRRHALHHALFCADDMAIGCPRELRFVLMHPADLAALAGMLAALASTIGLVASADSGWLALSTGAVYIFVYELMHTLWHLPPNGWVKRVTPLEWMRRFHSRHHQPELMNRFNFAVTVPIFDWVFRTVAPLP